MHVAPSDFEKLKAVEEDEISTLKVEAIKPTTHSRLGCQILNLKKTITILQLLLPQISIIRLFFEINYGV